MQTIDEVKAHCWRGGKSFAEVDADFSCFRRDGWVIIVRFQ